jgi:hypothetical protein
MAANNYDLTPVMAEYFDVHMFCPLLDFLREVINIYIYIFILLYAIFNNIFKLISN